MIAVAAGSNHSLALLSDGKVMAWGSNEEGQLGNGTTTNSDVPVVVKEAGGKELTGVTAIAAGGWSSFARLSNGTVMAWGSNSEGQLGDATTANSDVAVPVKESAAKTAKALSGVTAIAAGGEHTLALLSDGKVMAWGDDEYGELGDGKTTKSDIPVTVSGPAPGRRDGHGDLGRNGTQPGAAEQRHGDGLGEQPRRPARHRLQGSKKSGKKK